MKKYALLILLLSGGAVFAQPPLYMRKAKAIQAEARDMMENSRKNPQQTPDYSTPEKKPVTIAKGQSSPVHKAASSGTVGELQLLESKGYSLTAPDEQDSTPLHLAAYKGQKEIVEYLLSRPGLLKDPIDKQGYTPLILAASSGHSDIVSMLLAAGCDPKIKGADGGTALHKAAAQGQLKCVETLLGAGLNPADKDAHGKTPLELAEQKKKGEWDGVVSRLKQALSEQQ